MDAVPASRRVFVDSPNVRYEDDQIIADYRYSANEVTKRPNGVVHVKPVEKRLQIRTNRKVNRLGLMMVGWGGNNGSTLTAAIEAHRQGITWKTRQGLRKPNWLGSLTQASTVQIGWYLLPSEARFSGRDFWKDRPGNVSGKSPIKGSEIYLTEV
ncbi:unnamed protein product [Nesidiocoris tenuis]|uniref:Inositol-3-phosphate synthase n=1 Tax=Nesidiocoris tenuis TaxID=355587 RepID=A0A6H5HCG2_9HEMI|nr:unnamed protein product [Nesidiocoris tenuis]